MTQITQASEQMFEHKAKFPWKIFHEQSKNFVLTNFHEYFADVDRSLSWGLHE